MLVIEPATAVRFPAGTFDPSTSSRRNSHSGRLFTPGHKFQKLGDNSYMIRKGFFKNRVKACAGEQSGAASSPMKPNAKPSRYHPFEDIAEPELVEGEEARLTPAETARTIIEMNSKATLIFSEAVSNEVHDKIFWPDLPYVSDEYGNAYFQVKDNEDFLKTATAEDNYVQVIVGLDTAEILSEMELAGSSDIDIGFEEIDDDDSDFDDEEDNENDDEDDSEDDEEWVSVLEDWEVDEDSDESAGDWAKLDTMRSYHPMYFAKKLAEAVADDPVDVMDQPPVGLAIQGLLRPVFIEEHSVINMLMTKSSRKSTSDKLIQIPSDEGKVKDPEAINGNKLEQGSSQDRMYETDELMEMDETIGTSNSFYKLEMIKVLLISADGHQTVVEGEDLRKAKPDAIAHSAAKIISLLKAGGEKTTQALKSLCWRCKGIQVEEAALLGLDSLGFDLRICSGTQVQTLRFTFKSRASSEYIAERQLNDLLFPRTNHKQQKKQSRPKEL